MLPVEVIATGAVSALGDADSAVEVGIPGEPVSSAIGPDPLGAKLGIDGLLLAPVRDLAAAPGARAEMLLIRAWHCLQERLAEARPSYRTQRLGVVVGTSCGGMEAQLRIVESSSRGGPIDYRLARRAPYFGPLREWLEACQLNPEWCVQILGACASSTLAIGLACRWLELDRVDLVIAGGYDALNPLVIAGFDALGATSRKLPRPFRVDRDGMVLGEGAGLVALARPQQVHSSGQAILGFGASSDAVHVTAPDRSGQGLAAAALWALSDAGLSPKAIDTVSAHATATEFNDAAEGLAIARIFQEHARDLVVQPTKAQLGHTLGAAGVLESLAALQAIKRGVLPGAIGEGELLCGFEPRLLASAVVGDNRRALKLSAAFGGLNAALVLGHTTGADAATACRKPAQVTLRARGEPVFAYDFELVKAFAKAQHERLGRLDSLSELVLASVAKLLSRSIQPLPARTAVIVGSASATLEENWHQEHQRLLHGKAGVKPRRFPFSSPSYCAGLCSIVFQWKAPAFAVGAGHDAACEALLVAHDLVRTGDAEAAIVVAAECIGASARQLFEAAKWPVPAHGALCALLVPGNLPSGATGRGAVAGLARARAVEAGWPQLTAALDALEN